jgi:hypothetical protein
MNLERAFTLIRQLQGALDGMAIRVGAIGTINAGATTNITHGLGRTPVAVFTQSANGQVALGVDNVGTTTFRVANASGTNTTGYWIAVG